MSVHRQVPTLKFPSDGHVKFDWEAVKKTLILTDAAFNSFKDTATYVSVSLCAEDEWGDQYDYGVSRGIMWQDTQHGLPDFHRDRLVTLVSRILECSSVIERDGIIEFEGLTVRWSVKQPVLLVS